MNDWLEKLLAELAKGVPDNTLLRNYPISPEKLGYAKQVNYMVSKKNMNLSEALDYYPELTGNTELKKVVAEAKKNEEVKKLAVVERQAEINQKIEAFKAKQITIDPEDPIGSVIQPLKEDYNKARQESFDFYSRYANRDATNVNYPDLIQTDLNTQAAEVSNKKNIAENRIVEAKKMIAESMPAPSFKEAKDELNRLVKKTLPESLDVDNLSIQEIKKLIPLTSKNKYNETAHFILDTYSEYRNVSDALKNAKTLDEAALNYMYNADQDSYKLFRTVSGGDISKLPDNVVGHSLSIFLNSPATFEWAQLSPENKAAYEESVSNLFTNHPDFGKKIIREEISNLREQKGLNSWFANMPSEEQNDELFKELVEAGRLPANAENIYKEIRNDITLRTSGLADNILQGTVEGTSDALEFFADWFKSGKESTYEALEKEYSRINFQPKGGLHKFTTETGQFTGHIVPLIVLSKNFAAIGMPPKLASALATGIVFEHPNRERAALLYPNDTMAQNLYTGFSTAIDVVIGSLYDRTKAMPLIEKEIKPGLNKLVKDFTSGKISAEAAKSSVQGKITDFISRAKELGLKTLQHNVKQSAQMAGFTLGHDLLDVALGKKNLSEVDDDVVESGVTAFLYGGLLSGMAAHGEQTSKITASQLYRMAERPGYFKEIIKRDITLPNREDRLENLENAVKIKQDLDHFGDLTLKQRQTVLLHEVNQKILEKQLEGVSANGVKEKLKAEIKQSKEVVQSILEKRESQLEAVQERSSEKIKEASLPVEETKVDPAEEEIQQPNPREQTFTKGKHTIEYREGKRVVVTDGEVMPDSKYTRELLREHDKNYNYNFGEKADHTKAPEINDPIEAERWTIENSSSPVEVAEIYHRTEKESSPLSSVEQVIAENGIGKVKESSYTEFGDRNNINNAKARSYFKKDGQSLDVIAKEISDHTGLEVTPEDIVQFIDRFPNGVGSALSKRDGEVRQAAAKKFEELTGIPLTDRVAKNAALQGYTPERIKEVEQSINIETLPSEELVKYLDEQSKIEFENENIDNLDYGTEPNEHSQTSGADQFRSGTESTPRSNTSTEAGRSGGRNIPELTSEGVEAFSTTKHYGRIEVAPTSGEVKKLSDIIASAGSGLKQRILYIKPGQGRRRALGSYSPGGKAVKIKYEGDLDTTAHELGHAIDDQYQILNEIEKSPSATKELSQFSVFGSKPSVKHPNPEKYIRGEGLAEFIRALVVNPEAAKKAAPNLHEAYERVTPQEVKKSIEEFSTDVRAWAGATAKDMILSNVQVEKPKSSLLDLLTKKESPNEFSIGWLDKVAANLVNPLRAFEKAFDYAKGIKGIDEVLPANDPTVLARVLLGVDGKYGEILKSGMIDSKGEVINPKNPMTIKWLLEPLDHTTEKTSVKSMEEVISYMIAERTVELSKRFGREDILTGIGGGIFKDAEVAQKALSELESSPNIDRIKEGADRYRTFADATLRYMVDKGRLSEFQYSQIKENNLQYVALQRVLEVEPNQEVVVFNGSGGSIGSKAEPVKKIKGSTKKISNPYASLLDTLHKSVKEADRNEVLKTFRDMIYQERTMYEGDTKRLSDIGVKGSIGDKNAVTIFVDGKPEHWVFEQDIYKAIKGLSGDVFKLPKIVTLPAQLLRASVTNFPVFAMRNWVRDFQDRLIKSNNNKGVSGFTNIVGKKEDWANVARMGGLNSGYYMRDKASYYGLLKESMHDMSKRKNIVVDALNLSRWWGKYQNNLFKAETSNRVAEYRSAFQRVKEKGFDDYNASIHAAHQSRDLIDFAVMGHWMKVVNQIIPFSNAAVQGMRSTVVKAKQNPVGFALRTTLFSILPQAAVWYMNHRDDDVAKEYEALPSYQRDMFWNIKIGADTWLSVPKPFELSLAAAGTDRAMSEAWGNKKAFNGYGGTVAKSLLPIDESAVAGPYRGIVEILTNTDLFRDKSIIPPHEEPLNLALRNTSAASRLGKTLESVSGKDARYLDHFIGSQFSYFGNLSMKLSSIGDDKSRTKFDITDLGFFKHTPGYNSNVVQEMLSFAKEWGLTRSREYSVFSGLAGEYFDEKDKGRKDELAKELRNLAENMLKVWKEDEIDKQKIEKKWAKDSE